MMADQAPMATFVGSGQQTHRRLRHPSTRRVCSVNRIHWGPTSACLKIPLLRLPFREDSHDQCRRDRNFGRTT